MHLKYSYFNLRKFQESISSKISTPELNFEINNERQSNIILEQENLFKKHQPNSYNSMIDENLITKSNLQMRNNFIIKNNSLLLSSIRQPENRNLKFEVLRDGNGRSKLQIENLSKVESQKQKFQKSDDESFLKDHSFYTSKKEICNTHDSIDPQDTMISKQISLNLLISNKHDVIRVNMIKKGCVEEIQILEELTKNLLEFINTKKRRLSQQQASKQINLFFKSILNQNKNQLLGGGGCCSRQEINDQNFNIIDETQNNNISQNREFEAYFQKCTNKENIIQSIQKDSQLNVQKYLLKQCIIDQISQSEEQINTYQSEIQDLFEIYVMLEMTRVSIKPDRKQEEFDNMMQKVKQIKEYEQDFPIMELVFYAEILTNLNKVNHRYDENQLKETTRIKEFIIRILNFSKNGGNFSEIVSNANVIKQNINQFYKKKELFPLKYQIEIWVKKIEQFGDKFILISQDISQEILFYVNVFFEIYKQQSQQDQIILTLIRINYLLEKFQKDKSKLEDRTTQIFKQFSDNLIKANIDMFLNELMQKSDQFNNQQFLIFSVQNQDYRYITLSILININSVFTLATQNTQNQEYLLDFLSNKYLIEQEQAIRVLFEKSKEFVQYFNKNIKNETFKLRIIKYDKERKEKLLPFFKQLEDHERSINSFDDIIKLISDNAIQKWERDIKKRQRQNIAQKDDVLLEVKDLYISQMITYQKGNQIFKKSKLNSNVEEYSALQQNALQDILNLFLSPNYSYRLKCLNNSNSGENINENEQKIFKDQSNQCQILGILAEGGTGKSMFMKKIETFLIEKLSKLNTQTETGNYLPLLVKCNSLDSKNPSLDNYLNQQGINEDQLQNLKQNDRNKLILLDGYDEYTGDYFVIYKTLNLNQWKNTKIIVATRKEKLSEDDACLYFSKQNESGERDEMSYTLVKLEEFTKKDIHEYAERYFKQERKTDQINIIEKDLKNLSDCLTNIELEKLLHLPINLYLFTRMLVNLNEKNIQNLKSKVSDQIGIQEIFFNDQFEREAQSFIDAHVHTIDLKKDQEFRKSLKNCYFEYFQTIAMIMFLNRGVKSNYLQVEKKNVNFNIQQSLIHDLFKPSQINTLLDKIKNYINSKIATRSKEEINQENQLQNKKYLIEFKHKSLFEYFAARSMKYDFDVHGDNIYKLTIEQLKEFNINKKSIMNAGQNQSEQQILIKLYMMIKSEIESDEFYSTYHLKQIEKNSRYIQYLKKSAINRNTEISQIDIGASNMLSALFFSKFVYSKLELSLCSFSKLYVSRQKSDSINFDTCNLQNSYLKNLPINYDSCNTQSASFDAYQKVFDTSNIFSFNQVIWDERNILYTITVSGFINAFKIENQNILLQKSKQLSQTPLSNILTINSDTLLVSSQYSLFLINSHSFDFIQSYKFKKNISSITLIKENILVILENETIFHGYFKIGFRKMNIIGSGCIYYQQKQILLAYSKGHFSLYNTEENFKFINTIQGHTSYINSVAFSADGKYLATGSQDKTCKIWNAEKGFELINTIQDHTDCIFYVAFSEDGKYLATGSQDKTCKIWNAEKGFELINTIQDHTDIVISIAFSADGMYLATGSTDDTCKIWNAEKGFELINSIQGHTDCIFSVAFSADGKYLATGSYDYTCKIWNAEKGFELINTIQGHTFRIFSVAFSVNGKYLATGSGDATCKIWNAEKGFELLNTIQGHTDIVTSVAFSADGMYLATGSRDETFKIWNAEKGFELINTIQGHTSYVTSVAFSADGKYLATGSGDETCKIWNAEKGFELINTIQGHTSRMFSITFSSDGKYLATGCRDDTCKIWNAEKGFELIKILQIDDEDFCSVAFSADGKYFATGIGLNICKIWNAEQGFELINTIQGHTSVIFSVAFSANGKYLATGSHDKTFKIWNADKGFEFINTIQGHTDYIFSVAFSADGKYLATGSGDKTCKIWNAEKGFELINTIQGHTDFLYSVNFSADGKYLATGSYDHTCKIWNAENGFELINTIQGHTDYIFSVAFSVDGKYLATVSGDETCKIWNAEKGFELINTIKGHTSRIFSVAFSADGKYLATSSKDATCKIWNAEKGFELINTIQGHTDGISSIAYSADGMYLATGSDDANCKIWNAEKGFELVNTIQGHTDCIFSVAFSADGKYLATVSRDKTCKIWNAEKGFELINTIQDYTNIICSVAFSADRKYLTTSYGDGTCKIWNAEKGFELINTIQGHTSSISSVAFSADGKYICVEQSDRSYIIYDLQSLKIMSEQNNFEQLQEKYQFEFHQFEEMRVFENIYIL